MGQPFQVDTGFMASLKAAMSTARRVTKLTRKEAPSPNDPPGGQPRPMTGAQIVAAIDAHLGSTAWRRLL